MDIVREIYDAFLERPLRSLGYAAFAVFMWVALLLTIGWFPWVLFG